MRGLDAPIRRRRRVMSEINVVPYIDVMLVLLVIFMVTAPMLQEGVEIDLPQAPSRPLPEETRASEPIVVQVAGDGRFYVKPERIPLSDMELGEVVTKKVEEGGKDKVYVEGHRTVPYERVVSALVLLKEAGVEGVGLVTEMPDELPDGE
jgi:biopolymer transport protein TolR